MGNILSLCGRSSSHAAVREEDSIALNNVNSGITDNRPNNANNQQLTRTTTTQVPNNLTINSGRGRFYAALPIEIMVQIARDLEGSGLKKMRLLNKAFEGVAAQKIKHVKVGSVDELRGALKAFGAARGGLEKITLIGFRITDADLAELAKIPDLKHLDLTNCYKVTGRGLANLRHVPGLTHLNLPRKTTDGDLQARLQVVPNLEYLDLSSCHLITEAGMAPVRREGLEIVPPDYPMEAGDRVWL